MPPNHCEDSQHAEGTLDGLVWPETKSVKLPLTLVYTGFLQAWGFFFFFKPTYTEKINLIATITQTSKSGGSLPLSPPLSTQRVRCLWSKISPSPRASHVCWWSPLTSPTKAKLTLCHLPPAKEILVITCSFLNIIKHQPFHHSESVTFRFTAPLSVTDGSWEGQCQTIFISLPLMGPINRVLCWPPRQSARLGYVPTPPPTRTPLLTSPRLSSFFYF